jgi:hypothetical protein
LDGFIQMLDCCVEEYSRYLQTLLLLRDPFHSDEHSWCFQTLPFSRETFSLDDPLRIATNKWIDRAPNG